MRRKRRRTLLLQDKMKIVLTTNKAGLYNKFLNRLQEVEKGIKGCSQKDYLPFPQIFEKVCRNFSISKKEAWECLFLLREFGFIDVLKFRGIKLNFKIQDVKK